MMQWTVTNLMEGEAQALGLRKGQHFKVRAGRVELNEAGAKAYDALQRAEAERGRMTAAEGQRPADDPAPPQIPVKTWQEAEIAEAMTLPPDLLEDTRNQVLAEEPGTIMRTEKGWTYSMKGVEGIVKRLFPDMAEKVMHDFLTRPTKATPARVWLKVLKKFVNQHVVQASRVDGRGPAVMARVQDSRRIAIGGLLEAIEPEAGMTLYYTVSRLPGTMEQHAKWSKRIEQMFVTGRPANEVCAERR